MAVTIEKNLGRKTLIECMQDRRKLFATFNRAAAKWNEKSKEKLATFSSAVTSALDQK